MPQYAECGYRQSIQYIVISVYYGDCQRFTSIFYPEQLQHIYGNFLVILCRSGLRMVGRQAEGEAGSFPR